jgi:hypothetical protein
MADAIPLPLAATVIEETLDPLALMKLAPLEFTGREKITAAPELSSPVTVAVMMLVCPPLTEVGDAATETDRSIVGDVPVVGDVPAGASARPPVPHPESNPKNTIISTGISPGKHIAFLNIPLLLSHADQIRADLLFLRS